MVTSLPRKLLLGSASLALAFGATGCATYQSEPSAVADAQMPAAQMEMGGPALWRVADEDTTIYIFGTIHVLPDGIEWKTPRVRTALDQSDTLVTEIDMTPEAMAQLPAIVQQTALLPQGTTLRSLLSEEQRATYEKALTDLGLPLDALDPLEPWMAALSLSQVAYSRAGFDPEFGTESVLERAVGESMGRAALETVAFQLAIFDELPQQAQIDYLVETAAQIDELAPYLQQMVDQWAVGDVQALGDLMNEALQADPVLADRLLYSRNANWAVWIDERLDAPGTVFMAVGAGHLAGNQKLQDKLAARGIEITRVQ